MNKQQVKDYRATGKSQKWIALRMAISTTVVRGILTGSRVAPSASKGIAERQASFGAFKENSMDKQPQEICEQLPYEARETLARAAKTPVTSVDRLARLKAIDEAKERIRTRFPKLFRDSSD
ncbi:MAG TPA: hypothetical protein PK670_17120 [Acidovorax defluvii]|nr:hypothetical protein [Acidovorax defluvii]HQS65412.1 hypothetical protein [Acidovorax defluvii]